MQKKSYTHAYEEISLIDYFRTLKKRRRAIGSIILVVTLISLLSSIATRSPRYNSQARIVIGSVKNTPLASAQEVMDELSDGQIEAKLGEGSTTVLVSATDSSPSEAQELIKDATDRLVQKHIILYDRQVKLVDDQIQADTKELQDLSQYLIRFQRILNRPGLADAYQVPILQGYLLLRDRNATLKQDIENIQVQKLTYRKTMISGTIQTVRLPDLLSIKTAIPLGLSLGLILAILWAFAKEWWGKNRQALQTLP